MTSETRRVLGLCGCLITAATLLVSPDLLLGEQQYGKDCTGNASGCCPQADGCTSFGSGGSSCPNSPWFYSRRFAGSPFMFCESRSGYTCVTTDIQCCTIDWYSATACGGQWLCTTHLNDAACSNEN